MRILGAIPRDGLSEKEQQLREQLLRKAEQLQAEGVVELSDQ